MDINKLIEELRKEAINLMHEVKKHRCRTNTGNWCLDCEIKNAKSDGILLAIERLETSHNNDFKKPHKHIWEKTTSGHICRYCGIESFAVGKGFLKS